MSEDGAVTDSWGDPDPGRAWQKSNGDPADEQWAYFPPPDQQPMPAPPPVPWQQRVLPHAVTFGVTTVVLVLLGAPLALLWRAFATPPVVQRTASGPIPTAPESSQVFAVDGSYMVVTLVAGAILGALAWWWLRERGPAAPFGLAAGGLLAAQIMATVGRRMVVDPYLHSVCADCLVYDGTLHLQSTAAIVVLPVALLSAFAAATFFREKA